MLLWICFLIASLCAPDTDDDSTDAPLQATRTDAPMHVDGMLDEPAWQQAAPINDFTQLQPDEGATPSERTVVHLVYDEEALYVGAHLYDSAPDSIIARLGRRDADLQADGFAFYIDPYNDGRSGFYFGISASGTLHDGILYNDSWDDSSWDGVWDATARVHEQGWTVEMRIPYSQLRFKASDDMTWGINFRRDIARRNERDYHVYVPRTESGFVSHFADVTGIRQISPPRQLEVLPYVTARAEFVQPEEGNPFESDSEYLPGAGADFTVGLASNLTLNATVNPDFGQVEVDPAVVNLSDVETFFPEKRPFFIEGQSIFNFGHGGATSNFGFNWSGPTFFYSRRIGRAPQGSTPDGYTYSDRPTGTTILGAAKLTGKLGDGWNVGAIQSVTARESAQLWEDGETTKAEVEPATYYGIGRVQREWNGGRQGLGLIGTATARHFTADRLRDEISDRAFSGGVDGWTFLDGEKTWVVNGWLGASHVAGTEERMLELQTSSQHYFQRPDASHVSVDSSATSLTGMAGRVAINKERGNVLVNAAVGFLSPSFHVNDLGFQWRNDLINAHAVVGYNWTEPGPFYRRMNVMGSLFGTQDFGGNVTWAGLWTRGWIQFDNYMEVQTNLAFNPETKSNRLTRGGPLTVNPPGTEINLWGGTDRRETWAFALGGYGYFAESGNSYNLSPEVRWQPASNVSLSFGPQLRINNEHAQWVDSFEDPTATATFGRRYLFGELEQTTFSANLRLNWTFTPKLSLQLFAQPLISSGSYTDFKQLSRPDSYDFRTFSDGRVAYDAAEDEYTVDPDGSGAAEALTFSNPDFHIKSLRGNAVLRWEYRPGSTLFLVWTQSRSTDERLDGFQFGRSFDRLVNVESDNIFMLKLTYWLGT